MKSFVFDSAKCNGCRNCQIACKDEHCDKDWMPYAQAQPDTGQFWLKVDEAVRGQVPKVMISYTVRMCQHCDNAPCETVCPDGAFNRRDDGLLLIDPEKCSGCGACVAACPYAVIYLNSDLNIAQKCTGCAHLLDDGHEVPHCVDVCPHEALWYGELSEYEEDLVLAETLGGQDDLGTKIRYLNLPKRFVGGIIIDPEQDEVITGATVTLSNEQSGEVLVTQSDEFGDFWFKQIEACPYKLYVEYEGFMTRVFDVDTTCEDKNTGPLELYMVPSES